MRIFAVSIGGVTTVIGDSPCPRCGQKLDAVTSVGHRDLPKPGDFTIFSRCLEPLAFDNQLYLRYAINGELAQMKKLIHFRIEMTMLAGR